MSHEFPNTERPSFRRTLTEENLAHADDKPSSEQSSAPAQKETWEPEQASLHYREQLVPLCAKLKEVEDALALIHEDETIASRFSDEHLQELFKMRETCQAELVRASANYPGDWTGLLYERMRDPLSKKKFIEQRTAALPGMKRGPIPEMTKGNKYEREYQAHYQAQVENYDARLEEIFSITGIGRAAEYGKVPRNLGQNTINNPGIIFTDSVHKGKPLTSRQLNIVESHEKGHGLRNFTSALDRFELKSLIDPEPLLELTEEYEELQRTGQKEGRFRSSYVEHPDEIIERMSQFKNYFGMGADDIFTKAHLEYIREHYVNDIGLDNGVTDLLRCITPKTEVAFLKVINQYPI